MASKRRWKGVSSFVARIETVGADPNLVTKCGSVGAAIGFLAVAIFFFKEVDDVASFFAVLYGVVVGGLIAAFVGFLAGAAVAGMISAVF
jgi:hypothetical protein